MTSPEAPVGDLDTLLAVQDLDTAADVLRHRRTGLPQRAALATCQQSLAEIEAALEPTREARHQVERAQKAIEDDLATLAEKRAHVEAQMYSVTNAKELVSMQQELDSFDRRKAVLEDGVLEQMVEAEPLDAEIERSMASRAGLDEEAISLTAALAEAEIAIDMELAAIEDRRGPLVESIDPALLARYEKLRARLQGVGVARLDGHKCTGCHLTLPGAEVEQVKRQARDEGIAECPECDRLLVV
jgi:predicted  nucleic acid-binding Zn-ribbon protein